MKLVPCDNCPFRADVPAYIHAERGEEIWESLEHGAMFPCHKTVDYSDDDGEENDGRVTGDSKFCVGALLLMEREWADGAGAMTNQMVRICTRIGSPPLDLDALDRDAPGFDDLESWINYLAEGEP